MQPIIDQHIDKESHGKTESLKKNDPNPAMTKL
jgi:hypothetical protein